MRYLSILLSVYLISFTAFGQTTGQELVEASINYHDPENNWMESTMVLGFLDTRPEKEDRPASVFLDNKSGTVCITRTVGGKLVTRHIVNNECSYDLDGNPNLSESQLEEYSLNEERSLMLRNYYLYLWGLPMKLKDPGTLIDSKIYKKTFNGLEANVARVTYEDGVGSDIWYFYFEPESNKMIGYQFFHDEEKGDGEFIKLNGIKEINGMQIPAQRGWYTNPDSTLLGTDKLIHAYSLHSQH